MSKYIAERTIKEMIAHDKKIKDSNILILGLTFKEDCPDIRNTKVADLVKELESYKVYVDVVDPYADADEVKHEYDIDLKSKIDKKYDAVIVAVGHKEYLTFDEKHFSNLLNKDGVLIDVKGIFREKITKLDYWSL